MSLEVRLAAVPLALAFLGSVRAAQPSTTPADPSDPGPPQPAATDAPTPPPPANDAPPPPVDTPEPPPVAPAPPPAAVIDHALLDPIVKEQVAALQGDTGYKDGFILSAGDRANRLYIGAITQFDGRFFVDDSKNPEVDQFFFKVLRLDLRGTVFDHFDFRILPDFAGGKLVVQDTYVDIRYTDLIKLRIGKTKVPFGLERLQNEAATTFAERGLTNNLVPNRDLGLELFGEIDGGVLSYQVGIFNGVADGASGDGDATNDKEGAARVFVRPWAASDIKVLRNLGVGGAVTDGDKQANLTQQDTPVWKTQGQTTILQYVTGTTFANGVFADGRQWRATGQGYWYVGPFGLLSEYVRSVQHVVLDGTHDRVSASSWQVVGQWVLTGDDATFNSVNPRHPFDPRKGDWGAFDLVGRIEELGVDHGFAKPFLDPTKSAEKAWSWGVGADWFFNKSFRFVVDFERTTFTDGFKEGDRPAENNILGRAQLLF